MARARVIGAGEYGTVVARTHADGRVDTIKFANGGEYTDASLQLADEIDAARDLARIDCVHVPRFLGVEATPRGVGLVREYVPPIDGGDECLQAWFCDAAVSEADWVAIFSQYAGALAALRPLRRTHGDAHCSNLLLTRWPPNLPPQRYECACGRGVVVACPFLLKIIDWSNSTVLDTEDGWRRCIAADLAYTLTHVREMELCDAVRRVLAVVTPSMEPDAFLCALHGHA